MQNSTPTRRRLAGAINAIAKTGTDGFRIIRPSGRVQAARIDTSFWTDAT